MTTDLNAPTPKRLHDEAWLEHEVAELAFLVVSSPAACVEQANRLLAWAQQQSKSDAETVARYFLGQVQMVSGQLDSSEQHLRCAIAIAAATRNLLWGARALGGLSQIAILRGENDRCLETFHRAPCCRPNHGSLASISGFPRPGAAAQGNRPSTAGQATAQPQSKQVHPREDRHQ